MAHVYNPSTGRQMQDDCQEFSASSLGSVVLDQPGLQLEILSKNLKRKRSQHLLLIFTFEAFQIPKSVGSVTVNIKDQSVDFVSVPSPLSSGPPTCLFWRPTQAMLSLLQRGLS